MLWGRKKARKITGNSEIDFAAIELANLVKIKGVVLPVEIKQVCRGMSEKQIDKVVRKLKRFKIERVNGMIKYSKEVVGDEEMREKELREHVTQKEAPGITSDMIRIGTRFYEGIVATGFPEVVKSDWINRLLKENENFDFSIFILPESLRNLEIYMQDQLKVVESELYTFTQKNVSNPELEKRKSEILEKLENIAKGKYALFRLSLYALSKGVSEKETKAISNKIMSYMHSDGIEGKYATNYQKQIFSSIMPLGKDFLGGRQIIANSTTIAMSFPFRKR
ncbi:hypothetical protein JW707_01045 [Candidatus Woesearchaeota archaeon]|nr:hypothetical protein [Candidatus Woesearchaeota archaeon]